MRALQKNPDEDNIYLKPQPREAPFSLPIMESSLVALCMPLVHIAHLAPSGHLGYKSHVATVEQNAVSIASKPPRKLEDLGNHVLTVRKKMEDEEDGKGSG